VDTDGTRHRYVTCGVLSLSAKAALPERLQNIHRGLTTLLRECGPDCVVVENLFHAKNVRSALVLGHARGVAVLAAVEAGVPVIEYTPAEIKQAVVGYGRAEKAQMQQMVKLLLGLSAAPSPHDAADALAVALCHAHSARAASWHAAAPAARRERSWRAVRDLPTARRSAP
jgi:crossover junction endodeoxyribonuclease RuvC